MNLKKQKGQSVIEYLFLMIVVIALFHSFLTNPRLKDLFVDMTDRMEDAIKFSYQHGDHADGRPYNAYSDHNGNNHATYYNGNGDNKSHFLISHDPYP
ncbi:MAG: hypothetical protein OXB84_00410 [Halobacteriovoraceae bacterium]|nr:hypothetical protein [Halobacteriovoraceae bacterium]